MHIYFLLIRIAAIFGHKKAQKMVRGQKDSWEQLQRIRLGREQNGEQWIWCHVSSVGEFEQARPILERLRDRRDAGATSPKVLLTFFSPSGYEMRKGYDKVDMVTYLPFATRRNARRMLDMVAPQQTLFIKYEFWPAYLNELKKRNIPTYIIAAIFRKNQLFFRPWGRWYLNLLRCFTRLYVQDEASRDLLNRYHIANVSVAGDTRFDRVTRIAAESKDIPLAQMFKNYANPLDTDAHPAVVIVAGSTWQPDEQLLARYLRERTDVKLILVPHEIHEERLHSVFQQFEGRLVRYTRASERNIGQCRVLLLDTMGMLSSIYKYADVAYVGGGFGAGIHNTIEAAVWGVPVLFGPKYRKFREAEGLIQAGASFSVKDYEEFRDRMDEAIANRQTMGQAARQYVQSELGATEKIYKQIF
ncbi:MAG: 3-deoxy-D-manno-octulosonic acid transferase [Paludibacteraceae bacterium]|nr:3-deoxy-D-manno-octulosonic acid transferase [Paludibacteraceae bacterium]